MAEITAKDIAMRLGLSPSAVSLALNGKPGVSEKTRAQVLELASKLGYFPRSGTNTLPGRNKAICFIFYVDVLISIAEHTSFSSFVLRGVESAAAELGYNTMIRYFYAGQPVEKQIAGLLDAVDGIILLGTDITPSRLPEISTFISLASSVPIIVLDNYMLSDKVDCVGNDNFNGAKHSIAHLLQQGARRVGYFRSRQRIEPFDQREYGLQAALGDVGLTLDPIVDIGISSEEAFRDVNNWLNSAPLLPDAFVAENDVVAVSAIRALTMHKIKIPQQVAIIGYDDIPICDMVNPPLTTIRAFKELMGTVAVNTLHQRLTSGTTTLAAQESGLLKIQLSTKLLIRESSLLQQKP